MELAAGTVASAKPKAEARAQALPLYRPLSFFMARAPLLPVESLLELSDDERRFALADTVPVRRALAVASASLLEAIDKYKRHALNKRDSERMRAKLLRYQIRMSSRPTPFGLFAGVGLGEWGTHTDFKIELPCARARTRPDMGWLMDLVFSAETNPAIRKHLRLCTNPLATVRAGRVFLGQRAPKSTDIQIAPVSVRATNAVKQALLLGREPIAFGTLAGHLCATNLSVAPEKVEKLLHDLCEQTFLLTDLRPPLTVEDPAAYVAERLSGISEAAESLQKLNALRTAAELWDESPQDCEGFTSRLVAAGVINDRSQQPPIQSDMAMAVEGTISQQVAEEAARAAELLLRLSPFPMGSPGLVSYRQAFLNKYGTDREIPLLELLDPDQGLGPMAHGHGSTGPNPSKVAQRSRILTDLACVAMRDHLRVVNLDDKLLEDLATGTLTAANAPVSLDLNFLLAAPSLEAIDAGDFRIVIGPNLGAVSAGRNLGRFSHLLGPKGLAASREAAAQEEATTAGKLWVELVYLPLNLRMTNVVIRPQTRSHEIVLGSSAGVATASVVPLEELTAGVRDGRFYVNWPARQKEIVISSGHMLSYQNAPPVGRFLAEVGHDGKTMFSSFDWGPAEVFPYLPRVQAGRIVLREAQWRLSHGDLRSQSSYAEFSAALDNWRREWEVPQHICISFGDNRLILDLDQDDQRKELHSELEKLQAGGSIAVQEILPDLTEAWLRGPGGRYYSEFVASLVLRAPGKVSEVARPQKGATASAKSMRRVTPVSAGPANLKPPGSEWLFVKLYCPRDQENGVLADSMPVFADNAVAAGLADSWFFIRYADPEPHIRLRFHGNPERLTGVLFRHICEWATSLIAKELCVKFVFDTYEQETERFGGPVGMPQAEALFFADSRCAVELLSYLKTKSWPHDLTTLLALTADDFLGALGADENDRLRWYQSQTNDGGPQVGADYRERKPILRGLLGQTGDFLAKIPDGGKIAAALAARRRALEAVARELRALEEAGELGQSLDTLFTSYVHLHINRLGGGDHGTEQRLLSLLLRTRDSLQKAPLRASQRAAAG